MKEHANEHQILEYIVLAVAVEEYGESNKARPNLEVRIQHEPEEQ